MGTFANCRWCGERIEFVLNKSHKKVPLNIEPDVVIDKRTRELLHVRVSHFTTCGKSKRVGGG